MKALQLFIIFFIMCYGTLQAADIPLNFESGSYDITNFDGGLLTVIDNPQKNGINTSNKVAQMVKNDWETWGGSYITLDNALDFSVGKTFKMKVFSPRANVKVLLKVENASNGAIAFEKEVATTLANQWEELSFDYSAIDVSQSYRKVVLIFDNGTKGDGTSNFTFFIDDILLEQGIVLPDPAPQEAAPTPPSYHSAKVISIFSDEYTNVDGTNFNPYWQQNTVGTVEDMLGGQILKLKNLNYQGIELFKDVNAAAMKYLHLDVWTANETLLEVYPISRNTGERKANLTPLQQNVWNSFDIRLSDLLTQGFNLSDLFQMKFIGAGGNTVYIDNIYFYDNDATPDTEAPHSFTAVAGKITYNSIELNLNASDNSGAVNYFITVGGTTVEVGSVSDLPKKYEFTRLPSSTEFTFSIAVKDPVGNAAGNSPIQVIATTLVAFPSPQNASPVPPSRSQADVISIFSNSYTNVPNTNFNPYWQQNTWFYSVQVGGNEVLKYENFNYQGIEIGSKVDASAMTYLHIDLWTPNETRLNVSPISATTGEKAYNLNTINLNQWNSYDIALSSFTIQGLSMADILHLKFVGSGKSIIYMDNIYFFKGIATTINQNTESSNLKCYPNPFTNYINLNAEIIIDKVEILSLSGQLLKKYAIGESVAKIDLDELNKGYYLLVIDYKGGSRDTQKIIKQ